jgi:hypothetical protein
MSAFAAKLARLASAEGEEDADILRHHRVNVLLAEAAAILRAGSSASHRAQAAEKIVDAVSDGIILDCNEVSNELIRACTSSSFDADAADVGEAAAALAQHLDIVVLMRLADRNRYGRIQLTDKITALLELIGEDPESVDESLRRLGTTLTAARLEFFSLQSLVETTLPGDPVFPQSAPFARRRAFPLRRLPPRHRRLRCSAVALPSVEHCLTRNPCRPHVLCCRMVELDSTSSSYAKLAAVEFDAGNPRAAYAPALRAVAAARRERSFVALFSASNIAGGCVQHGALGATYRWGQLAPFLDNMEEALPHLKRWMPPATLDQMTETAVTPMRECRRLYAHSDR